MVIVVENQLMLYLKKRKLKLNNFYTSKYFDCTYTSFAEYLAENENIYLSIDAVRTVLRDRYILSPRTHKSTRKRLAKN